MAFPDSWLDELLNKTDLVSLVSSYCTLKAKGKRLWGLCPIHGEKTPSFSVTPDKQMFYCFGCHQGGTAIQFLMLVEHLSFYEAVKNLAERCNMSLPDDNRNEIEYAKEREHRDRLFRLCNSAARFYMEKLIDRESGAPGRAYLKKRGITSESVKRFGIGYAPQGWDNLKNELLSQGYTTDEMLEAGLLVKNENKNSIYDAYRNRIIFPIIGVNQNVIGFGARVLDNSKPKYINTGDTILYNKRNNLYGLNLQKGIQRDNIVIVEGYTDVISLFEIGIDNVVASLGTALTVQQARLLKRYVSTVYIAYDGDYAGQTATLRGLDILSDERLDVRVIEFPDNLDPDEFARKFGKAGFEKLKSESMSLTTFKIQCMAKKYNLSQEPERERFAIEACRYVSGLQPIQQGKCLKQISQISGYSLEELEQQTARNTAVKNPKTSSNRSSVPAHIHNNRSSNVSNERIIAETRLFQFCMLNSDAFRYAQESRAVALIRSSDLSLFTSMVQSNIEKEDFQDLIKHTIGRMDPNGSKVVASALNEDIQSDNPRQSIDDCAARLMMIDLKFRQNQLNEELSSLALSKSSKENIMKELIEINKQIRVFSSKQGGKNNG